jgi:hypothetical protein
MAFSILFPLSLCDFPLALSLNERQESNTKLTISRDGTEDRK